MIEYRLYHDDNGHVISYSVKDMPGKYIVITKQEFAECRMDVTVGQDGKIIRPRRTVTKIEKSASGIRCHKYDVNIIVDENDTGHYWSTVTYERK
jgi:hypothetical protein